MRLRKSFTFIVYAVAGHLIPGPFAAQRTTWDVAAGFLAFDANALPGGPLLIVCNIVISFVFFGNLLRVTGGADFLSELAQTAMGRYRGGPAKVAVAGSALFGSISGSAVANVAATGVVTIPMIRKSGYSAQSAAAIEAVSSTGGQLLPPVMGAAAFLMADFLRITLRGATATRDSPRRKPANCATWQAAGSLPCLSPRLS
jgi:TRAP-type uncharacterized transport system fused permease subunit